MKYIEFGIGNRWGVRTETELADGSEYEEKGIVGPIKFYSAYIRVWIGTTVFILDLKEGLRRERRIEHNSNLFLALSAFEVYADCICSK